MPSRKIAVTISLLLASSLLIPVFALHPVMGSIPLVGSTTCTPPVDFLLDATPSDLVMIAGATASSTITVAPRNGFSGTVSLAAVNVPSDIVNPVFSSTALAIGPGIGSSTLTFATSNTVIPGNYSFDVNATTSGTLYEITTISVKVPSPEIGISADKFFMTIQQGSQDSSIITVASLYGFSGTVSLTASVSPIFFTAPTPPTTAFSQPSVNLLLGAQTPSTLTVSTISTTTPGAYSVTITGSDGALTSNSTYIYLQVTGSDFSINPKSHLLTLIAGGSATNVIEVNSTSFSGTVTLSVDISSFFGVPPTGTFASPSVTLNSGDKTTDVLTIDASSATPGYYLANVTGTSGTRAHWTIFTISIVTPQPGFSITPSPASLSLLQGGVSAVSQLDVHSLNSFAGDVNLSIICYPEEISASLDLGTVTLTDGGTSTARLTVSAPQTTTPGLYLISIIGEGATTSATNVTSVEVNVTGQDFTLHANPASLNIVQGGSGTSTISYTGSSGFTGSVSLTPSVIGPAGIQASLSSSTITSSSTSTLTVTVDGTVSPGPYYVAVTGASGSLTHTLPVAITVTAPAPDFSITAPPTETVMVGTPTSASVTVSPIAAFTSNVILSTTVTPSTGLTATLGATSITGGSGTSVITLTGTTPGSYTVTITGTGGGSSHQASMVVFVQDFTISASPSAVTFAPGASAASTISFSETGGLYADISLSKATSSPDLSVILSPTISVYGAPITAEFHSTTPGTYTATITGTTSGITKTVTISVTVTAAPNFTVSASPTSVTTISGTAGTSTVTVAPVNGFTGTVALTTTISPTTGLTCTLSPSGVTLGTSGTSSLSCNGATGTYTVTVTGTSGSTTHTQNVQFTVNPSNVPTPDFTVTPSVSSLTIAAGKSNTVTINVTPTNGFNSNVGMSASVSPAGPTLSLSTSNIYYGSPSTTLTVNVGSDVAPGTYTITVKGESGGTSHTSTIVLTVTSPEQTSTNNGQSILGLEPLTFYSIIGVVIVAALVAGIGVAVRMRKPKP